MHVKAAAIYSDVSGWKEHKQYDVCIYTAGNIISIRT